MEGAVEEQDQPVGPGVNAFQGIDVNRIRKVFERIRTEPLTVSRQEFQDIAADVLELLGHVEDDGLLKRVEEARREMAEQVLPGEYRSS